MRTTTRRIAAATAAGALALALAACGDDSEAKDTSEKKEPTTSQAPTPDADTPDSATPDSAAPDEASETPDAAPQSDDALQTIVDQANGQMESMKEAMKDTYSDIAVEREGDDTVVYRYVFKDDLDRAVAKDALAKTADTLEKTARDQVIPLLESAGIKDPKVRYVYEDNTGKTVHDQTIGKS